MSSSHDPSNTDPDPDPDPDPDHDRDRETTTSETPPGPRPDPYDLTAIPSALDELYDRLIHENSRVCTACFTRLARRERFPDQAGFDYSDLLAFVDSNLPPGAKWEVLDIEYHERVQFEDRTDRGAPPGRPPTRGSLGICANCGTCHPQASPPPRSYDEAMDHALNLSKTLTEYAVEHDYITLLERVRQFKTTPRLASRDRDVFAAATAIAIADATGIDFDQLTSPPDDADES